MDESPSSGTTGNPQKSKYAFRFAGVELRPEENSQDAIRAQAKDDLRKNSIMSVVVGAGATVALIIGEQSFNDVGFLWYRLPAQYPYISHGLLFFYIGWATYYGARDCINANLMDEEHGANRAVGGVFGWIREIQMSFGALGVYATVILVGAALIVYNLLGGGIYGFYKLLRDSRK
jgi:hypothetical protein